MYRARNADAYCSMDERVIMPLNFGNLFFEATIPRSVTVIMRHFASQCLAPVQHDKFLRQLVPIKQLLQLQKEMVGMTLQQALIGEVPQERALASIMKPSLPHRRLPLSVGSPAARHNTRNHLK